MKKLFLLNISILLALPMLGQQLSEQEALKRAKDFMQGKSFVKAASSRGSVLPTSADDQPYYVFNAEEGGFVIVSGDARTKTILGYSDYGSLNLDDIPVNLKDWLQGYAEEIEWAKKNLTPKKNYSKTSTRAVMSAMEPLIQTMWDQHYPYNLNVPTGSESTGCVATALAQLMYYHAVTKGTGLPANTLAAGDSYVDNPQAGTPFVAGEAFQWSKMKTTYGTTEETEPSASDAVQAVAHLMSVCGYAVKMQYYPTTSSAATYNTAYALRRYFGYPAGMMYKERNSFSQSKWEAMISEELASQRPVLYRGRATEVGHAFIIDGCDGAGLYHVNWGWGGRDNGYFLLSVLNSDDKSGTEAVAAFSGYNQGQEALFGVDPSTSGLEDEYLLTTELTVSGEKQVKIRNVNLTGESGSFDYGIAIINGATLDVLFQSLNKSRDHNGYGGATYTLTGTEKTAGTYKIVPVSRKNGSSTWNISAEPDYVYITAVYDGNGGLTLTAHPCSDSNISASSFSVSGLKKVDTEQTVNVTINNTSDDEYYGTLFFFANTTMVDAESIGQIGVTVPAHGSSSCTFNFTPNEAGTYNLWVATDDASSNVIGSSSVVISEAIAYSHHLQMISCSYRSQDDTSQTIDGDGNVTIDVFQQYPDKIIMDLKFKNVSSSDFTGRRQFKILKWDDSSNQWKRNRYGSVATSTFKAGEIYTWTGQRWSNLTEGKYAVGLYEDTESGDTELTEDKLVDCHFRFNVVAGYATWDKNGNKTMTKSSTVTSSESILAYDLTSMGQTPEITANSNPNTLYYFSTNQTVPANLSGKNVVNGETATNITLGDGYDFYVPKAFMAHEISYSRTFTNGVKKSGSLGVGGWSSIMLPFAVSSVKVEGVEKQWFTGNSETDKHFWLKKFVNDDGAYVSFDHVSSWIANTPYIIAVPSSDFGTSLDLTNKEMVFSSTNSEVKVGFTAAAIGNKYTFRGTTATVDKANIYILNANGDSFELKTSVTAVKPFRAYFVSNEATGGSSIPALLPTEGLTITGFFSPLDEYDEIQLISTGKGTYCSSFDLNFANVEGLNAYITSGYDDKTNIIWLTRVKSVPAGTGIVLKGEPNGHYQVPRAESRSYYANMLVGNYGEAYQIESTTDDYKNFVMKGGQFVGIEAGTTATVGKNRAYLQIPSRIFAGTRSVSIGYDDGNGTTSVDRIIEHETQEDGVFYNLQGQRVEKPGKGLYIKNGKKVIVR